MVQKKYVNATFVRSIIRTRLSQELNIDISFDIPEFNEEKIRNEVNQYAENIINQIKTCQENLEEAINVKAFDADKYESLKEDFRFLNQRSSQLMEEIHSLRQINEKLL